MKKSNPKFKKALVGFSSTALALLLLLGSSLGAFAQAEEIASGISQSEVQTQPVEIEEQPPETVLEDEEAFNAELDLQEPQEPEEET
ncbi:hypothetical protein LJC61_09415, partial [Ruminococcaceae bacterium OttesenSCG-928-A16]|nr:hypothetical protein [Ruminococcaceae bacterium OttesenSCG-928-A16]